MAQVMNASQARENWSEVINKVFLKETRVIVEKSGIPVAAIISAEDLEKLNRLEAERQADFSILDEIRDAFNDVPADEIEREVAKAVAAVRAEARQKRKDQ
jgi:prevent-host-death family protein